jgi:hypothetical protein
MEDKMRREMFGNATRLAVTAVALIMICGAGFGQQRRPDTVLWTDSTKDVHINGVLDRGAQVLTSEETRRSVLISPKLERAAVLDSPHTVTATSKDPSFRSDRASAQSDADFSVEPAGNYTMFDDRLLLHHR